jgi:hypothetical protein
MLEKMGNTALPALPALQAVAGNTDPKMKDLADMAKKAIETITKDETLKKK